MHEARSGHVLAYVLHSFSGKFSVMRWSACSSTTMFTSNSDGKMEMVRHKPDTTSTRPWELPRQGSSVPCNRTSLSDQQTRGQPHRVSLPVRFP